MTPENYGKLSQLTILWADDDPAMPRFAERLLGKVCKKLLLARSGLEAVECFIDNAPDIILMDVHMPEMTGLEAVAEIRERNLIAPIVMITGQGDNETILQSVKLMVEDYIIKPPTQKDVFNALNQCIGRLNQIRPVEYRFPNGVVCNTDTHELTLNGEAIKIPRKEALLLEILLHNQGRIVTTEEIYWHIWKDDEVSESAFKSVLSRLRKKIGKDSIQSHSGIGYSLSA